MEGQNMNQEEDQKIKVLTEIWTIYTEIRDILVKAGIPENRLPETTSKLMLAIDELHLNKLRHGKHWIEHFRSTHIQAWQKIRSENTEEYWDRLSMMGFGKDFTEVKALAEISKAIRKDWFVSSNALILPKKEKKEK